MVKVYTITVSWFQKSREEFGQLQTRSEKSTTYVKIHQIPHANFETLSNFSQHNLSVFF